MSTHNQAGPFSSDAPNLDFLRAVAVLAVFACHFVGIRTSTGEIWDPVWHLGKLGVQMFFVHTSLVLMWSAERLKLEGWRLFASFYVRRVFRIYPLSIFCVVAAYCFFHEQWHLIDLWTNLSLTQNLFRRESIIVPLWSLPLEIQMYIVLPLLFLLFRERSLKWLFGVWLVSVPLMMMQPKLGDPFLVLLYGPCFLGGVLAWRVMRTLGPARLPGWLWPPAIFVASAIWMVAGPRSADYCRAAFGLCLGLSIPLFREIPWKSVRTLSHLVAKYSYGIYLSHFSILLFVFRRLPHHGRFVHWTALAALTIVVPLALYHGIEAPAIRWGKTVAGWITRRRDAVQDFACVTSH